MVYTNTRELQSGSIIDVARFFKYFFLTFLSAFMTYAIYDSIVRKYPNLSCWEVYFGPSGNPDNPISGDRFFLYFFLILTINFLILTAVNIRGYRFDLENNEFHFPGGGKEPNTVLDYLNPLFWLNKYFRQRVALSEISMIEHIDTVKSRRNYDGFNRCYHTVKWKTHKLYITGEFGAYEIDFSSSNKLKQVYNKLRAINKMGKPVNIN